MIAMAHVYLKMKDYDNATTTLFTVWEISQAKYGDNSEEVGQAYYELANAHLKKKDYNEAIKFQRKSLQVYQGLENFRDTDHIANIAITLSKWLEMVDNIDEALDALKQAE